MNAASELKRMLTKERYQDFSSQIIFALIAIVTVFASGLVILSSDVDKKPIIYALMLFFPVAAGYFAHKKFKGNSIFWIPIWAFSMACFANNSYLAQSYVSLPFNLALSDLLQLYLVFFTIISLGILLKFHAPLLKQHFGPTNSIALSIGALLLIGLLSLNQDWFFFFLIIIPFAASSRSLYAIPAYLSLTMVYFSWGVHDEGTAVFSLLTTILILGIPLLYQKSKQKWG